MESSPGSDGRYGTEGYLSWTVPHLQHRHPSVPYRPSLPGGGDVQQWMGRQRGERHLRRIQPCTCQSHCHRQEQQRLRHTSLVLRLNLQQLNYCQGKALIHHKVLNDINKSLKKLKICKTLELSFIEDFLTKIIKAKKEQYFDTN